MARIMSSVLRIFFFLILGSNCLFAQSEIDFEKFKAIEARNIGPAGMSGRITAIDVDLSNEQRIFVGSASGGVWLSENGGINWTPIFDEAATQSIGSIKINQSNPSEIWVGTGEGNPRNSQNSGAGVYKSIDGGKSWTYMGLKETKVIHRIAIDESQDGVVYIGAQGSAWGKSTHRGVYKTTDGGKTWNKILYSNDQTGIADMVMDPHNPNKLIAAMWEFGRTPWFFNSGGKGSGLHITYDGGKNWKKISSDDGLPKGNLGRIGVAIAPGKPHIIYALVEAKENALYKSIDGGESWKKISTHRNIGNRPFYYSEIYVDPHNENRIYSLWSYVSKSEDGGKTFDLIADYGNSVHPDHHAFWIHPDRPEYLIDGNDGGLNISNDMGKNWRFVNNLPVGQFYHVNVDDDFPYHVYGGMQDNGSWVGPAFVMKSGGITNHDWQEVFFGDGFDVAPKPNDSRYIYAMSQGGNLGLVDKITGAGHFARPNHPDSVKLRYNWNAPLALQPNSDCGLYYGSQFVHYSKDCGQSWQVISPDLTTNDTSMQHQDVSGGLTIDATNAENHTTLITIAPSSIDADVIWAGSDDGRLHITKDHGQSWTDVYSRLPGAPHHGWIPQITTSTYTAGEAWVVVNNYRQNEWDAYLYHTTNYGTSWQRVVDNNDVKGFVTSFIQDTHNPNLLFLGSDVGLYISFDKGRKWHHWTQGLPPVQIRDLAIQSTFDDLVLGTFGRAFWIIDDIGVFRSLAEGDFTHSEFDIVSSTDGYNTEWRSYQGIRFYAQGEFIGDNKQLNPTITLWTKKSEEKKTDTKNQKKSKDKDKITIQVIDTSGDTLRTFTRKVNKDSGIQKISWNMRADGINYPSRRQREPDADTPNGMTVLPGEYKIIVSYGDHKDSSIVEVKMDPRLDFSSQDLKALRSSVTEFDTQVLRATDQFDKLKEANKSIAIVEKLTETLSDSTKSKMTERIKEVKKEIAELEELYMEPQNQKGIQRNPYNLMGSIRTARRYLMSSYGQPQENAKVAIAKAYQHIAEVETQIKEFFDGSWTEFKAEINEMEWKIFGDME